MHKRILKRRFKNETGRDLEDGSGVFIVISRRAKRTAEDGWKKSNNHITEENCGVDHVSGLVFSWKEFREP